MSREQSPFSPPLINPAKMPMNVSSPEVRGPNLGLEEDDDDAPAFQMDTQHTNGNVDDDEPAFAVGGAPSGGVTEEPSTWNEGDGGEGAVVNLHTMGPGLGWVQDIVDASADYDRLRTAFLGFVFAKRGSEDMESEESSDDSQAPPRKIVQQDSRALQMEAEEEFEDLVARPKPDGEPDALDEELEEDDDEYQYSDQGDRGATGLVRGYFQPLILEQAEAPATQVVAQLKTEEFRKQKEDEIRLAAIPERLQNINGDLASKFVHEASGITMEISKKLMDHEPWWIFRRLTEMGNARHHGDAVSLAAQNRMSEHIPAPITAICEVLRYVRTEGVEPAYLMLYRQHELQPLLRLIYGFSFHSNTRFPYYEMQDKAWPHPEYAYCSGCGTRATPEIGSDGASTFVTFSRNRTCNECYQSVRRKPCSVTLGRLLWDIVELDIRFLRVARRLTYLLKRVDAIPELLQYGEFLEESFTHRYEMDFFDEYVKYFQDCTNARNGLHSQNAEVARLFNSRLWSAYREYAIEGTAYSRNLLLNDLRKPCLVHSKIPMEWAQHFVTAACPHSSEVLRIVQEFMVSDFAHQPLLLSRVVESLKSFGTIEFSRDGVVLRRYLKDVLNHPDGLLQALHDPNSHFTVDMEAEHWNATLKFEALLQSAQNDDVNRVWNNHRWSAKASLIAMLRRNAARTLRAYLLDRATWYVTDKALTKLSTVCAERGYQVTELHPADGSSLKFEDTWDVMHESRESIVPPQFKPIEEIEGNCRVLSVYVKSERDSIVFTQLTETTELRRVWMWAPWKRGTPDGDATEARYFRQLEKEIAEYQPNVIAIGMTKAALPMFRTLKRFCMMNAKKLNLDVVWVPMDIAYCYSTSGIATEEFTQDNRDILISLSIGRRLRDPLTEVARLCNNYDDILKFPLCEGQQLLNRTELRRRIDEEMSLWVSARTLNINYVIAHNAVHLLQYVAGLGPVKAHDLIHNIRRRSYREPLKYREELESQRLVDPKVFRNCAGVLRFEPPNIQDIDPTDRRFLLDNTRIHPDTYNLAVIIICNLFEIRDIKRVPEALERLRGSREEELAHGVFNLSTIDVDVNVRGRDLEFLFDELVHFRNRVDIRRNFRKVTKQSFFEWMSGVRFSAEPIDPDYDLRCGSIMRVLVKERIPVIQMGEKWQCVVRMVNERGIAVETNNNVKGFVSAKRMGDSEDRWREAFQMEQLPVRPGDHIDAVVVGINYDSLTLEMSWSRSELETALNKLQSLAMNSSNGTGTSDSHLSTSTAQQRRRYQDIAKVSAYQASRHPLFQKSIRSGEEAEQYLRGKGVREIVIRYCDQNNFAISFNILPQRTAHIMAKEERGANGIQYRVTERSEGAKIYEDLDHCIAEHIETLCNKALEFTNHPAYYSGTRLDLEKLLIAQCQTKATVPWRLYIPSTEFVPKFVCVDPTNTTGRRPFKSWTVLMECEKWIVAEEQSGGRKIPTDTLEMAIAVCKQLLKKHLEKHK
eukprot:PhF_6_TR44168/c1_g1_i3/m.67656/K11292/SUPT6H, SPT6; transcription elongation factor SPT6